MSDAQKRKCKVSEANGHLFLLFDASLLGIIADNPSLSATRKARKCK
jgi:hypothetical protein